MKIKMDKAKIIGSVKNPLESILNIFIASTGLPPESLLQASKAIYRQTIGRL